MVKRYDCAFDGGDFIGLQESDDGSVVSYLSYQEIEAKCAALAAENARVTQALSFASPWLPTCDDELTGLIQKAKQTPNTDAWVNEQRAVGVEMFAAHCQKRHGEMMKTEPNEYARNQAITATRRAGEFALYFAEQLRGSQV